MKVATASTAPFSSPESKVVPNLWSTTDVIVIALEAKMLSINHARPFRVSWKILLITR